ncbi:hypothetical protein MAHJHV33_49880 [Mycobacterium avium subsp. hominissuis]
MPAWAALAAQAGIEHVYAELRPEDKAHLIAELGAHRPTAMVGDGVNDAPALAAADHRGGPVSAQFCDQVSLVLGAQFGIDVLDAGLGGERRRGGVIVAGEHRHLVAAGT